MKATPMPLNRGFGVGEITRTYGMHGKKRTGAGCQRAEAIVIPPSPQGTRQAASFGRPHPDPLPGGEGVKLTLSLWERVAEGRVRA